MLRRVLFTAAMLASTSPLAQGADGGPAPSRCGADLTDQGACYGDVAAWCEEPNAGGEAPDGRVRTLDCAALTLDEEDVGAGCLQLPGLRATCGVPEGASCALPGEGGVVQLACVSGGALDTGATCDLDRGCVAGPPCSGSQPSCAGALLQLACAPFGQALVVDCGALGGRCEADACVDVEEGGRCGAELRCADGLECIGDEGGLGTCLREGAPVTPVEPPEEEPPPPPASCAGIRPLGALPFGWLALTALVFSRRWRAKRTFDR